MSKARRRTEVLNAEFVDGYAAGWCFGVHEAFRANLDISLDTRVDRAANEALAARLGRKPTAAERITREVWTQGSPPAYAFARGHLMHEPVAAHRLPWVEALPLLRRSILVTDAQPDEGTAVQPTGDEESGRTAGQGQEAAPPHPTTADAASVTPADSVAARPAEHAPQADGGPGHTPTGGQPDDAGPAVHADDEEAATGTHGGPGWVEFEMLHYDNGVMVRKDTHRLSQQAFVRLLQEGCLPPAA